MANSLSARKKIRADLKKCEQNNVYRVKIKKGFKSLTRARKKDVKDTDGILNNLVSSIDKSVKKKVIKKNKAARLKSKAYRLASV